MTEPSAKAELFSPVGKPQFSESEERILDFWRQHDIAKKSFEKESPRGAFVFYEGPPTANGKPGIHHVSARSFKDLFLRYKTMQGYRVERRSGWDTHGLPVEVEVEKEIGSTGKSDIERYGIDAFNKLCRESVFRYIGDWNALTERIAFWLDLDHGYITYHDDYIETCWWLLKSLWERGLLYEDYKTNMHCPRCNSTLADHEVSQGMEDGVDDPSIWAKFRLTPAARQSLGLDEEKPVSFLIWTTTPWTLPANAGIAVRADAEYVVAEAAAKHGAAAIDAELYVVAADLAEANFGEGGYRISKTFQGADLVGLTYEPIFYGHFPDGEDSSTGFRVVGDDFVSLDEGTGLVHIAPAYGDLTIGREHELPLVFSVDLTGRVYPEVRLVHPPKGAHELPGLFFKEADSKIVEDLFSTGHMYRSERILHAYPQCWRDDSPLLFYSKKSWYIRTTAVKSELLANNAAINWVPKHVGEGRFGRWLENNIDWAISRERYWGTPLPIWETEDGSESLCIGSVAELSELAGRDLSELDLHRPYIDEVSFEKDGKIFRRVPYTIDVWFESGAMPYAQWHYPFENQERFAESFPADYICEATDQTRGWFYSLHALATLLTSPGNPAEGLPAGPLADLAPGSPAFRNCLVVGFINDDQGRKMSKSRGNAVDPWSVLQTRGADALRWYLFTSGPADQNKNFDLALVDEALRGFFLTLWNVYGFLVMYANIDRPGLDTELPDEQRADVDRWLLARLQETVATVTERLGEFDAPSAGRALSSFVVDDVSNWFLRINRRRFWKSAEDLDKLAAYRTLYETLVAVVELAAPMAPFVTEEIYQNLVRRLDPTAPESVHLTPWPTVDETRNDPALLDQMGAVVQVTELARSARSSCGIKVRQPLPTLLVRPPSIAAAEALRRFEKLLLQELNVKRLELLEDDAELFSLKVKPNFRALGPRFGKQMKELATVIEAQDPVRLADKVRQGEPVELELGDETLRLSPEDFQIDAQSREGLELAEGGGFVIALDTQLTAELELEGRIRDLVRLIQNARKNAGLMVTDHIALDLGAAGSVRQGILAHGAYIQQEVLADSLTFGELSGEAHHEKHQLGSEQISITLRRATK